MSGWNTLFDVVNLAVNVGNAVQLAGQREQLGSIQGQQMLDELRRRIVEMMRNEVFGNSQQLKVLHEYKEEAPQAVYVAARSMAWKLVSMGITYEAFPEISDKEYTAEVWARLKETIQDAQSRLGPGEQQDADGYVQLIGQMPLLNEAIEVEALKETRQDRATRWQQAEAYRRKQRQLGSLISIGAVVPFVLFFCFFLSVTLVSTSRSNSAWSRVEGAMPCLIALAVIVTFGTLIVGSVIQMKGKTQEWKALKAELPQLDSQMAAKQGAYQQVYQTFGEKTSAEYRAMRDEREARIRSFFAGAAEFALPAELRQPDD